jgi:hypothetical protein
VYLQQKCDAKRPCSTCVDTNKAEECIYDRPRIVHHPQTRKILPATANALSLVFASETGPQSSSASSPKTLVTKEGDPTSRPESQPSSFTPSGPSGSTIGVESASFELPAPPFEETPIAPDFENPLPPRDPPDASSSELVLWGSTPKQHPYDSHSTLSFISSLRFPKIPPALHVPLSFLGEPNIQISHTTTGELELTLWVSCWLLLTVIPTDIGA